MLEYEWDVETIDEYGDIVNHEHDSDLRKWHREVEQPNKLVLVRDVYNTYCLGERSWAYVENGKLPLSFQDAYGNETGKVPKRFHKSLEKLLRDTQ